MSKSPAFWRVVELGSVPPLTPAANNLMLGLVKKYGFVRDHELHIKRADGANRWVVLSMQPTTFDCEPALIAGFYDVTALSLGVHSGRHEAVGLGAQRLAFKPLGPVLAQRRERPRSGCRGSGRRKDGR